MGKIRIHYGGAVRDKDKFVFNSIALAMPRDTILLVPDQYTLQAERNAMEYLETDTLFELSIMSRTSFINHVLESQGKLTSTSVDKYGKFMLLSKITLDQEKEAIKNAEEKKEALINVKGIFDSSRRDRSFINLINDLISEMKQAEITSKDLMIAADELKDSSMLQEKLVEIANIYDKYERLMVGKFSDQEDLLKIVTEKLPFSKRVADSIFWMDGIEVINHLNLELIRSIATTSQELNIVLGDDNSGDPDFTLSAESRKIIKDMANESNIPIEEIMIPTKYSVDFSPEIKVVEADDIYNEAETAAINITRLVRDENFRYKDIYLLCNDIKMRGAAIRRVFEAYGIPFFMDTTRKIFHDPAIHFLLSMIDIIDKKRRLSDIFFMLKTGYGPLDDNEIEDLENYCIRYNIRNGYWKKDFIYGTKDYGSEYLKYINNLRNRVWEFLNTAENLFKGRKTVREKVEAIWKFIKDKAHIPEKLGAVSNRLEIIGNIDYSQRTAQIWKSVIGIFDQIVEVLGDECLPDADFRELLRQGFEEINIGILPTNNDQVICGALPRSMTGKIKSIFVLGANEGILPPENEVEGLLSHQEKILIEKGQKFSFGKKRDFVEKEHSLALRMNLSKVEKYIFISYTRIDSDGNAIRPSRLITEILRKNPKISIERDEINGNDSKKLVQTYLSSIPYVTLALRKMVEGEDVKDEWKAAILTMKKVGMPEEIMKGIFFDEIEEKIKKDKVLPLYGRGFDISNNKCLRLSASAIEKYARCPFAFFLSRGLRPRENRHFEVDLRSIGDIYHECMRSVSQSLTELGKSINSEDSLWMTIKRDECEKIVSSTVDNFSNFYREGVFNLSSRENYIKNRIEKICSEAVWLMISQVRQGNIKAIYFEKIFSDDSNAIFPGIKIEMEDGRYVTIEGKIDRVDIIEGSDGNYVKIIDYKSGNEKFDLEEVEIGFRLQLMIYLKGAMGGISNGKPAGVFYFHIGEMDVDVGEISPEEIDEKVNIEYLKSGLLDGIFVEDEIVISGLDGNFDEKSYIVNIRKNKDGTLKSGKMLSLYDFNKLMEITDINLHNIATGIMEGIIDVKPLKGKLSEPCAFCTGRSICNIALKK